MTRDDIIRMAREASFTGSTVLALDVELKKFAALVAAAEREKYDALFGEIKEWSEAYPETIFPTPDWEKVRDALEMNGLTLDAVSAANMRHVLNLIQEMADQTIRARGQG